MNETLKLCINCKYLTNKNGFIDCCHPNNIYINLVFGEEVSKKTPGQLRHDLIYHNACGEEGRWWERKEENGPF